MSMRFRVNLSGYMKECATCSAKPGSPTLCEACLFNRDMIADLQEQVRGNRALGIVLVCVVFFVGCAFGAAWMNDRWAQRAERGYMYRPTEIVVPIYDVQKGTGVFVNKTSTPIWLTGDPKKEPIGPFCAESQCVMGQSFTMTGAW